MSKNGSDNAEAAKLKAELAKAKAQAAVAEAEAARLRLEAMEAEMQLRPLEEDEVKPKTKPARAEVDDEDDAPLNLADDDDEDDGDPSGYALSDTPAPPVAATKPKPPAKANPTADARPKPQAKPPAKRPAAAAAPGQSAQAAPPDKTKPAGPKGKVAKGAEPETDELDPLKQRAGRSWFRLPGRVRKWVHISSAWSGSFMVHAGLLVVLAMWAIVMAEREEPQMLTVPVEDRPQEEINQVLEETLKPSEQIAFNAASSAMGASAPVEGISEPTFDAAVEESTDGPKVQLADVSMYGHKGHNLNADLSDAAPGQPSAIVDDYQGAMDRITQELLMMLSRGKVLVIWCFDQSESMKDDQEEIRGRIDKVYAELGLSGAARGDALLTSIVSYGEKGAMHTSEPTSDSALISKAISEVPTDPSGKEIMCQTIGQSIAYHRKYASSGRRQMALIVVTDESGEIEDNLTYLERTIAEAKSARCRIYCLGREAVFGYPYAHIRWKDPQTKINFWLRIDRGPESPFVEQLQTNGFYRRYDAHPSGFGPYEQCRMCRETGGVFFMLPSLESNLVRGDNRKYELEMMRPYLPDLGTREKYAIERAKSDLRMKLWQIINDLNPWDKTKARWVVMRHDFSISPAQFAEQVRTELIKSGEYVRYLHHIEGELESLLGRRDQEPSNRWQANFDLLYAQCICYKVRLYEYNAYLQHFMKEPKKITNPLGPNKKTNNWELRWRKTTLTEEETKSYMVKAEELFQKVISEHPGTPWAARAEYELKIGFGVELVEDYDDPRRNNVKLPKF